MESRWNATIPKMSVATTSMVTVTRLRVENAIIFMPRPPSSPASSHRHDTFFRQFP